MNCQTTFLSQQQSLVIRSCYNIKGKLHLLSHPTRPAIHQMGQWDFLGPWNFGISDQFRLAVKTWDDIEKDSLLFFLVDYFILLEMYIFWYVWYKNAYIALPKTYWWRVCFMFLSSEKQYTTNFVATAI